MAVSFDLETLFLDLEEIGVFYYVVPFLIIFAIIYAILEKSKWLGDNRSVQAIVSAGVGLLSIQFGLVQDFFNNIFPKMGIGLAIILVLLIFIGFFIPFDDSKTRLSWIGYIVGFGVVIWAFTNWSLWGGYGDYYFWEVLEDYFGAIIAIALTVWAIWATVGKDKAAKAGGH